MQPLWPKASGVPAVLSLVAVFVPIVAVVSVAFTFSVAPAMSTMQPTDRGSVLHRVLFS